MKKLLLLIAATALLATTNRTLATGIHNPPPPEDCDFTFADYDEIYVKLSKDGTKSYTGWFNILKDGFDPVTMDVCSAVASFWFKDDSYSDGEEKVDIDLGSTDAPNGYYPIYGYLEKTVNIGSSEATLLADLQDGILSYTVTAVKGDFYFKKAKLEACACTKVPDGGSSLSPDARLAMIASTILAARSGFSTNAFCAASLP